VTGLAAEARIVRRAGLDALVAAGDPDRLVRLVELAAERADILVSFGIAGALLPELRPGMLVVASDVVAEDGRWRGEARWRERVAAFAREVGGVEGGVFGASRILADAEAKRRARAQTGALIVDLESSAVARSAAAAGVAFIVVRAVADTASRSLPPAALIPLTAAGTPDFGHLAAAVLRRPGQIASLVGLARDTRKALTALVRPARALGRVFAAG
jgi:adenosylhomocysteine nucleosidase